MILRIVLRVIFISRFRQDRWSISCKDENKKGRHFYCVLQQQSHFHMFFEAVFGCCTHNVYCKIGITWFQWKQQDKIHSPSCVQKYTEGSSGVNVRLQKINLPMLVALGLKSPLFVSLDGFCDQSFLRVKMQGRNFLLNRLKFWKKLTWCLITFR